MPDKSPRSLRSVLAGATLLVAVLAIIVSGALIFLTTVLRRTTIDARDSVESIRLAEEAQVDLLLHDRVSDPIVRREIEGEMRRRMEQARQVAVTERETTAVSTAWRAVDAYLGASGTPAEVAVRHQTAYGALEDLISLNVTLAREADARAEGWNALATGIGVVVATLSFLVVAILLFWLRRSAFEPLVSLASVMERFAGGDREARARLDGAAEVREIGRHFNEMAAALGAQREAQVAFLGGVAHDLRNPLSALNVSVQRLQPDRPLPEEPRLRQIIARLSHQIARMRRMLDDFVDMAKVEAGQLDLEMAEHDARSIVEHVVDLLEEAASEHHVVVRLPERGVLLRCDQLRLEQVLTNLVSNAIKYSPLGTRIEIALESDDDEVMFRVSDEGVGIGPSEQARIFEPFRRSGLSKGSVPGTGLGLFVVKRLVEAHQGRIEVESVPGQGSTFRVRLRRSLLATESGAEARATVH